jgi:hypothetical protein
MPSKRSSLMPIPREIQEQEKDIEWLFRHLLKKLRDTTPESNATQRQEAAVWVFIVMLGLISLFALYALYVKTSG